MRAQVGQVPTPQGISALLKRAGFRRSTWEGRWASTGYRARKRGDEVRVTYHGSSMGTSRETEAAWCAQYAKVIRDAGWQVDEAEPPAWPQLTVSARPIPAAEEG